MPLIPVKSFWLNDLFPEVTPEVRRVVKHIGTPLLILPIKEDYMIKGDLITSKICSFIINGYPFGTVQKHLSLYGDTESSISEDYKLTIEKFSSFIEDITIKGDYEEYIEEFIDLIVKKDLFDLYWEIILND